MAGTKFDSEKNRLELFPPLAHARISEVFTFGAKKYSAWNWAEGIAFSRIYGALLRHMNAWYTGEDTDPESGKSHLAHAGCCITMLLEMAERRKDLDDRPIQFYKPVKDDNRTEVPTS